MILHLYDRRISLLVRTHLLSFKKILQHLCSDSYDISYYKTKALIVKKDK